MKNRKNEYINTISKSRERTNKVHLRLLGDEVGALPLRAEAYPPLRVTRDNLA